MNTCLLVFKLTCDEEVILSAVKGIKGALSLWFLQRKRILLDGSEKDTGVVMFLAAWERSRKFRQITA